MLRILICLLFASCQSETITPPQAPADFTIEWTSNPVAYDEGHITTLLLAPDPRTPGSWVWTETESRASYETGERVVSNRVVKRLLIGEDRVQKVYDRITANAFFSLDPEYRDPYVHDGATSELRVLANGKRHEVRVTNTSVPRFSTVALALRDLGK